MSGRLPSDLLVGALLRRVNDARGIGADGSRGLIETGPKAGAAESLDDYWQRRRQRDPDLWVVALDIPQAKRFAAETIGDD